MEESDLSRRLTTAEFIEKAKAVHGDIYDYSKVVYTRTIDPVVIICKVHGEFSMKPNHHLCGHKCAKCVGGVLLDGNTLLAKIQDKYGDTYDYTRFVYVNSKTKSIFGCKKHGWFSILPHNLLNRGCPKCNIEKQRIDRRRDVDDFLATANKKHNYKFKYIIDDWRGSRSKIKIICPIHGEFEMVAIIHLRKHGCSMCGMESRAEQRKTPIEEFITKAKSIHGNKYDYSHVLYKNNKTPVSIICPVHGTYKQTPNKHLIGRGCPRCSASHGETAIRAFLESHNINYIEQYSDERCWYKRKLRFDFALFNNENLLCLVEFDGEQHFREVPEWGGHEQYQYIKTRDAVKDKFCKKNDIPLFRIKYTELDKIPEIMTGILEECYANTR